MCLLQEDVKQSPNSVMSERLWTYDLELTPSVRGHGLTSSVVTGQGLDEGAALALPYTTWCM